MTTKQVNKLDLGFYLIIWKNGGLSRAAVGNTENGDRWIAPINWVSGSTANKGVWRQVKKVIKI